MSGNIESELFYLRDKVTRLTKLNAELRRKLDSYEVKDVRDLINQKGWGYSE